MRDFRAVGGSVRRPAHRARRARRTTRGLRAGLFSLVILLVVAAVLVVAGILPSRAAQRSRGGAAAGGPSRAAQRSRGGAAAGGADQPAASDRLPGSSGTSTSQHPTAPEPSTTPATHTSTPTTTTTTTRTAPTTTTTTTIPLTTKVPRPPAPPATVPASGVFASGALAPYLASEAKASIDMTATVFDATNGQTSTYWPTLRLTAASSMKLDILEVLLDHAQHAGRPLSPAQASLSAKMIEDSTNTAAQNLWDTEGGAAAMTAYDGSAGLSETAPNEPGYWGLSTTGASDLVRLMSDVAFSNPLLDGSSRSDALGLLTHVLSTQAWGASAGVPAGVTVAIKDGWLRIDERWEINTTAWVEGAGRDYVVAVMSWGDPTGSAGIDAVDGLCSRVWGALAPA